MITSTFTVGVLASTSVVEVTKTVWDPVAKIWTGNTITVNVGDMVRFNITTKYTGSLNLFEIHVNDTLTSNLRYVHGSATFKNYKHVNPNEKIIGNTIYWNFTDYSLILDDDNTSMSIEFQAEVLYSDNTKNTATVTAIECCDVEVSGEDCIDLTVPALPVQKQVWNGTGWTESINATRNQTVQYKITILNHAAFAIKNMIIHDVISGSSLKYIGPWTITKIGIGVNVTNPVVTKSNANQTINWSWQAGEQLFIPHGAGIALQFTAKVIANPVAETVTNTADITAWGDD